MRAAFGVGVFVTVLTFSGGVHAHPPINEPPEAPQDVVYEEQDYEVDPAYPYSAYQQVAGGIFPYSVSQRIRPEAAVDVVRLMLAKHVEWHGVANLPVTVELYEELWTFLPLREVIYFGLPATTWSRWTQIGGSALTRPDGYRVRLVVLSQYWNSDWVPTHVIAHEVAHLGFPGDPHSKQYDPAHDGDHFLRTSRLEKWWGCKEEPWSNTCPDPVHAVYGGRIP